MVADLRKVLENEEKAHEVLEQAMLPRYGGSTLRIPSFLPKKTKELLAELVMVEEEIARLEREVSKIQKCSSQSQEAKTSKSFDGIPRQQITRAITYLDQLLIPPADTTNTKIVEEKIALETKPLFFINQAIKGDYSNHGFASKAKKENITETVNRKENRKVLGLQERITKKSGVIERQSSPKPPRHALPRPSDASTDMLFKSSNEHWIVANPKEKNGLKLQANKLSEKIMKCLLCIFLRLMRMYRVSELEKSGNLSRSPNTYSRSRSFRLQNGLNLNTSLNSKRETTQQDPYGIFYIEDSQVRDIGPYKNLVRCTSSSLDVKIISSSPQLMSKLRTLLNKLCDVEMRFLTHHQKLAFWINIYNACIMQGFLQYGIPSSPEKILHLKNKAMLNVGGNRLNAIAIEHYILRQPSNQEESIWKGNKDDREDKVRSIHGLEQSEPNIWFALCCGSRSSPAVRIYTADGVSAELEKAKLEYLQASIAVTASKRLKIPKLLAADMHDFATDLGSLVEWICNQLPTSGSLRKSMAECLRRHGNSEQISNVVDIIPYDFEFQYLLPI